MSLPILLFYGFSFIGIVHSVIFSILAIRNKRMADLIITGFLFVQAVIILEYIFYWTGLENSFHYLCNVSLALQFLFGPFLLMYVDFVFFENKKSSLYMIHFIPAIIVFILMLPYFLSTADLKLHHYKMIPYFIIDPATIVYLIIAHMTFYFGFLMLKIGKEKRVGHIKNWLLTIVGIFGFYIACYVSYYVMVNYSWFNLTTDYFVSTGLCASIIAIVYFAYSNQKILNGYKVTESLSVANVYFSYKERTTDTATEVKKVAAPTYQFPSPILSISDEITEATTLKRNAEAESVIEDADIKYKNSGLTFDAITELAAALHQLMQKEKLYRKSELKLETLAMRLGVARHYVSQVINQHYGVNFFEYINVLRIEEAKQLLSSAENKNQNIIEVAYAVGYTTKNTFNTAFRRIVGVTPTEYRNQNQIRMN